jgi:hypothetical protein
MDLENKLNGIPPIFYLNLDHREDRKDHIEEQFRLKGITDYTRISASRFSTSKIEEWGHKLDLMLLAPSDASIVMNQFTTIIDWYNSGISEYCIIMQDDLSLDLVDYWMFDWKTLMKNLPYNWDCIQFYFCHDDEIRMHLHKRTYGSSSAACYMITRLYAEKLIKLHLQEDGSFKLKNDLRDVRVPKECYSSDDFLLYQVGVNYSIPLLCLNQRLAQSADNKLETDGDEDEYDPIISVYHNKIYDILSSTCIKKWWENQSNQYTLEDIFSYGKTIHEFMKITVPKYNRKVLPK